MVLETPVAGLKPAIPPSQYPRLETCGVEEVGVINTTYRFKTRGTINT